MKLTDYEKAYSSKSVVNAWENAPGKQVIVSAFLHFYDKLGQKNKVVADIGCGTGYLLNLLHKKVSVGGGIIGVDFSEVAIRHGRKFYPAIDLRCEDGTKTSIGSSTVDFLVSYGSYEHFRNHKDGIAEAARILKNDAIFLIMVPTLGIDRTDRTDEGWYEEREIEDQPIRQMQWNLYRDTWEKIFEQQGLKLFDYDLPVRFGAKKPGVFYFGCKL
jgi:SAM-dependent methyltransferase